MEFLHQSKGFDEAVLQRQYGYFKDRPAKTFVETRVRLMTLDSGAFAPTTSNEQGSWDLLKAPDDVSTEKYLDECLDIVLRSEPLDPCLQICFLTPDSSMIKREFSMWQNAVETFRGCQQDLYLAPARIISQRLKSAWNLESITKPITAYLTSDLLPSKKFSQDPGVLPNDTGKTYTLHWQNELLTYTNDLNVYVWQPHLEQIPSVGYNSATIILPANTPTSDPSASFAHRLVVVADPPSLMTRFLSTEDAFVKSNRTQHMWDADHETLRIIAVLLKWIVDDSSVLVDKMTSRTTEMMYKGRSLPTRSKIQYLIHLDDCRRTAIADLQHTRFVVGRAELTVASDDFCCQKTGDPDNARAHKVFTGMGKDIEFLIEKLELLEKLISTAREQIIEQMSLAQGQRALILTIAAAFFIPLSFVASIFGMNVKTPLFPHPSESKGSSSSAPSTPTTTVDPSGPSQHYWTMSQYLEISLPLTTAVILLPLIAGPCFKFASQQYEVRRRHWRALFVVLFACYSVSLILAWATRANGIMSMVYLLEVYFVLGMISLVRMVRAYRQKQGRLRWSLLVLTFTACMPVDLLMFFGIPWGLIPILSMFLTSRMGVRWSKRGWTWLNWKTRRQSASGYSSVTIV